MALRVVLSFGAVFAVFVLVDYFAGDLGAGVTRSVKVLLVVALWVSIWRDRRRASGERPHAEADPH